MKTEKNISSCDAVLCYRLKAVQKAMYQSVIIPTQDCSRVD